MIEETLIGSMTWAIDPTEIADVAVGVQVSAHGSADEAHLLARDDRIVVRWSAPHRRVAIGQSVVIYVGDFVAGGGIAVRPVTTV